MFDPEVVEGRCGPYPVGVDVTRIRDGLSTTLLFVEASRGVPWTKPEDLPFDLDRPPSGAGSRHNEGFVAVMADGSTKVLRNEVSPKMLKAIITRAGGETVNWDD